MVRSTLRVVSLALMALLAALALGEGFVFSASKKTRLSLPNSSEYVQIVGGTGFTVALRLDGTVWAWGRNDRGQLGFSGSNSVNPVQVAGLADIVQIDAGVEHTLALRSNGAVYSFGGNTYRQLGGVFADPYGAKVLPLTNVASVQAGAYHSLARDNEGKLWAWGRNSSRQSIPASASSTISTPTQVPGIDSVAGFSGGWDHTVISNHAGEVYLWGKDLDGIQYSPKLISGMPYIERVSAGAGCSYAVDNMGRVYAWGANSTSGQLGTGDTLDRATPTEIPALISVMNLDAGLGSVAARLPDGSLWAWGAIPAYGTSAPALEPMPVPGLRSVSWFDGGMHANGGNSVAVGTATPVLASITTNMAEVPSGYGYQVTARCDLPAEGGGFEVLLDQTDPLLGVGPVPVLIPEGAKSITIDVKAGVTYEDRTERILAWAYGVSMEKPQVVLGPKILFVNPNPAEVMGNDMLEINFGLEHIAPHEGFPVEIISSRPDILVPPPGFYIANSTLGFFSPMVVNNITVDELSLTLTLKVGNVSKVLPVRVVRAPKILSMTFEKPIVVGGDSNVLTVKLDRPIVGREGMLWLTSSSTSAQVPWDVFAPVGSDTFSVPIHTTPRATPVNVTITGRFLNSVLTGKFRINAPKVESMSLEQAAITGGDETHGYLTLDGTAPVDGYRVQLTSYDPCVTVSAEAWVTEGEKTTSFVVFSTPVTANRKVRIRATAGGSYKDIYIIVKAPTLMYASASASTVVSGGSLTISWSLSGPAPAGGAVIRLSSSDPAITVPATVTMPEYQGDYSVTVTAGPVRIKTLVTVTLQYGGATRTVKFYVKP